MADVVVLYSSPRLTVHDAAFRSAVTRTLAALPADQVSSTATYWSTGSPQFVGSGGHATYAVVQLAGGSDSARLKTYDAVAGKFTAPGLTSQVGGQVPTFSAINKEVTADIGRAEFISMPVLLILMLLIFGSLAAASLPLAIGAIGILGSFAALRLLTLVTGVSIYSVNITTILGLGLAIDYGLFMVSRFREELQRQPSDRGRGGPHGRHGRPHGGRVRGDGGRGAGRADAVPRDVPALDGLRRGGHGRGRHAGRADRAACPAGRARAAGQRAAGAPPGRAAARRTSRAAPGTGSRTA